MTSADPAPRRSGPGSPGTPAPAPGPTAPRRGLREPVLAWYAEHARQLPWRLPGTPAWEVLVSEVMLAQTPVTRVLPAYGAWLARWPDAAALAAAAAGEAVRQWGTLGYPRRALRLHAAAAAIVEHHGGAVPDDLDNLRALPGVGPYTAAAVASFGFRRQSLAVLDTNVRRVLARAVVGVPRPVTASVTVPEMRTAEELLPRDPGLAATWGVAVMELGALVCTARTPHCGRCPIATSCAWRRLGHPPAAAGPPPRPAYAATDRAARGFLLARLRAASGPLPPAELAAGWPRPAQAERALASLVADGLAEPLPPGRYRLPGTGPPPPPTS